LITYAIECFSVKRVLFLVLVILTTLSLINRVSAATLSVPDGGQIQSAIEAAQCGDTIELKAGATFDGSFTLPNKNCTSATPITIRSSAVASLPNGRVSPADAVNMARIRTTGNWAAMSTAPNAGYWIVDGIEFTDNITNSSVTSYLLDFGETTAPNGPNHITVQRCYLHPKEIGNTTAWERHVRAAIQYEGSYLVFRQNYAAGFEGYDPGTTTADTWRVLLSVGGPGPLTITDNYMEAWYSAIFTGGGDTNPTNTATVISGSTTSATLSNTTGIVPGMVLRLALTGTGLFSGATLTRISGTAITGTGNTSVAGRSVEITNTVTGTTYYNGILKAISGDSYTITNPQSAPAGIYNYKVYWAVKVNSVSGTSVNYDPWGPDGLLQAPSVPGQAAWAVGDGGTVHDITIQQNTFSINPTFAHQYLLATNNSPKGYWEMKSANRVLIDGNRFTGYASGLFMPSYNQQGGAPWIKNSDITISNNWYEPTYLGDGAVVFASIQVKDPYHSNTIGSRFHFYNNVAKNVKSFIQAADGDDWQVYHNTVINTAAGPTFSSFITTVEPLSSLIIRDNIAANQTHGLLCLYGDGASSTCWPSKTASNNAVVDNNNVGLNGNWWGANSILAPVFTTFDDVGFMDQAHGNYRLSSSSAYFRAASDRTDVGVNVDTLNSAMSGSAGPSPTPTPSATPTPTPTPTPSPIPSTTGFAIVNTDSNAAAVVNSLTMMPSPFDVLTLQNFSVDLRTRITIFSTGVRSVAQNTNPANDLLIGGTVVPNYAESVVVEARRSDGTVFLLPVEFAGTFGAVQALEQVNAVLVPALANGGNVQLTLLINGQRSNSISVFIW